MATSKFKGMTYEEIYGEEKAKILRKMRSVSMSQRVYSDETRKKMSDAKKGKYIGSNNPFYGKQHSPETIEKIRKKSLGKKAWNSGKIGVYSEKTLKKMRDGIHDRWGENNPNWRGGSSFIGQKFRMSKMALEWKKGIFLKDDYVCVRCLNRGGKLHAHHIVPFSLCLDEEKFTLDNGATLCVPCHRYIHSNELSTRGLVQHG